MPDWLPSTRRAVAPGASNPPPARPRPAGQKTKKPPARPAAAKSPKLAARPARPVATPKPPPPGPRWDIAKFKAFYEEQVNLAQELLEVGDDKGAKETLTNAFKRLQSGCRQFESDTMLRPLLKCVSSWTDDVKNRLQIVQSGGDFNTGMPLPPSAGQPAAVEMVNSANAEIDALVEATVPETKANIAWADVIGIDEAVQRVREAIELPHMLPQFFSSGALQPWRGILLWGPPGTGKTMLAQAAANGVDAKFYCVTAGDIVSKWMGQGEKFIKALFRSARQQPSIIFIDEIDSLLTQRSSNEHEAMRRIKTQFLQEMEGFSPTQQVTVIGATNVPWEIDDAALRRLEARVWVPLPSHEARKYMFKRKLSELPHHLSDANFDTLAARTHNFSGSDIKVIIKDAGMRPVFAVYQATHLLRNQDGLYAPCASGTPGCVARPPDKELKDLPFVQDVTMEHMLEAVDAHPPAVDSIRLTKYDEYKERLQRDKQENE